MGTDLDLSVLVTGLQVQTHQTFAPQGHVLGSLSDPVMFMANRSLHAAAADGTCKSKCIDTVSLHKYERVKLRCVCP